VSVTASISESGALSCPDTYTLHNGVCYTQDEIRAIFFGLGPAAPAPVVLPPQQAPAYLFAPPGARAQHALDVSSAFTSAGTGAAAGTAGGVPGVIIGAAAGFLAGLFTGGGAQNPPTLSEAFVITLRQYFPDQNAPVCGTPIDIGFLNGGSPAILTIPCDDPAWNTVSRSTLEWWLKTAGLGTIAKALWGFITGPKGGAPLSTAPQTAGGDQVATNVSIAADAATALGNAIGGPIGTSITGLQDVVTGLFGGIGQTVSGVVQQLAAGLAHAIGNIAEAIANGVKGVLEDLARIVKTILSGIKDAIDAIAKFITETLPQVLEKIVKAIQEIKDFYQDHILPILQAVKDIVQAVNAVEAAIRADLKAGIEGLLRLPADISNAITSIDASLQRAIRSITEDSLRNWAHLTGYGDQITMHGDLTGLGVAAQHIAGMGKVATTFTAQEPLVEEDFNRTSREAAKVATDLIPNVLKAIFEDLSNIFKGVSFTVGGVETFFTNVFQVILHALMVASVAGAGIEQLIKAVEEEANRLIPLTKLGESDLQEAFKRNFIDAKQLNDELRLQGYDESRTKILVDLTVYLIDIQTAFDMWFRGIIEDKDLDENLKQHGILPKDIDPLKQQAERVFDPAVAAELVRRGEATEKQFRDVLAANRYSDQAADAAVNLLTRFADLGSERAAHEVGDQAAKINIAHSEIDVPPDWYMAASERNGLNRDAAIITWTAGFQLLDLPTWINLYFRGLATPIDIDAAMERARIPQKLRGNLIDSQRPLIPFRTIPGMLAAGIINESRAYDLLQQHGYSLPNAQLLIKYAQRAKASSKAATATTQHAESVAAAKTLHADGAITDAQYVAVLLAHGFDQASADAQLKLENIQEAAANRKAQAQIVIDQFQAGEISRAEALQQLAQMNFSLAEQAKYGRMLKTAATAKAKIPGEAELRAMAVKGVIEVSDYTKALVDSGFSMLWADAFTALHFPASVAP